MRNLTYLYSYHSKTFSISYNMEDFTIVDEVSKEVIEIVNASYPSRTEIELDEIFEDLKTKYILDFDRKLAATNE